MMPSPGQGHSLKGMIDGEDPTLCTVDGHLPPGTEVVRHDEHRRRQGIDLHPHDHGQANTAPQT
jgi:hypothetical protein